MKLFICLVINLATVLALRLLGEYSTDILRFGGICCIVGILNTCFMAWFLEANFTRK